MSLSYNNKPSLYCLYVNATSCIVIKSKCSMKMHVMVHFCCHSNNKGSRLNTENDLWSHKVDGPRLRYSVISRAVCFTLSDVFHVVVSVIKSEQHTLLWSNYGTRLRLPHLTETSLILPPEHAHVLTIATIHLNVKKKKKGPLCFCGH